MHKKQQISFIDLKLLTRQQDQLNYVMCSSCVCVFFYTFKRSYTHTFQIHAVK